MRRIAADLHIHTALSPCAADEMTPPSIVQAAIEQGLDMIAICDHNSAGNAAAVQEAAGAALSVLAGMEITTAEEAHVLGLFPDAEHALAASEEVGSRLPRMKGRSPQFGEQWLLDASGAVIGRETRMLSASSGLVLEEAVALIKRHSGLAVASHVDRPSYSVTSQLGMIPPECGLDALEISAAGFQAGRQAGFAGLGWPFVVSSDSHYLSEIGAGRAWLEAAEATFEELARALRGEDSRRCSLV